MVKMVKNKLKLKSGKVIKFKSGKARKKHEKVAKATRHGFRPAKKGGK